MTPLQPVTVTVRLPDARYFLLHAKCAAGTIAADELAELDMLCAEKEREWEEEQTTQGTSSVGNHLAANNRPERNHGL